MDEGTTLLHFSAGSRRFALPVGGISEIREAGAITPVPGAPKAIAGIIDMRGRIVTLMDLAAIFGLGTGSVAEPLAVQLADPYAHLALLVPAAIQDLRTETGTAPQPARDAAEAPAEACSPALGREILLAGGAPALLLDLQALTDHCTARVRDRFRVTV